MGSAKWFKVQEVNLVCCDWSKIFVRQACRALLSATGEHREGRLFWLWGGKRWHLGHVYSGDVLASWAVCHGSALPPAPQGVQKRRAQQPGPVPQPHQEMGKLGTPSPGPREPLWGLGWAETGLGCRPTAGPSSVGPFLGRTMQHGAGNQPCCGLAGAGSDELVRVTWGPRPCAEEAGQGQRGLVVPPGPWGNVSSEKNYPHVLWDGGGHRTCSARCFNLRGQWKNCLVNCETDSSVIFLLQWSWSDACQ